MSRRPPPRNEPRKAVGCHGGASPRRNADCFVHRARAEAANPKDRNSEPEMRKGTKRDEKGWKGTDIWQIYIYIYINLFACRSVEGACINMMRVWRIAEGIFRMTRLSAISCEAADGKTAAMLCAIEAFSWSAVITLVVWWSLTKIDLSAFWLASRVVPSWSSSWGNLGLNMIELELVPLADHWREQSSEQNSLWEGTLNLLITRHQIKWMKWIEHDMKWELTEMLRWNYEPVTWQLSLLSSGSQDRHPRPRREWLDIAVLCGWTVKPQADEMAASHGCWCMLRVSRQVDSFDVAWLHSCWVNWLMEMFTTTV